MFFNLVYWDFVFLVPSFGINILFCAFLHSTQYLNCLQAVKNFHLYQLSKEYLFLLLLYASLQEHDIHVSG